MVNIVFRNILRFVLLVLVQIFIIKNIELGKYINPFIYVLFILALPFETPDWLLIIIAFLLGLVVDMFYDTIGIHSAACVTMAFVRPKILNLFSPREGYEFGSKPSSEHLGLVWFLSYSSILIFIHHFILFFLEVFRISNFFDSLLKVFISSLFTLILVVTTQFLINRKKQEE